MKKLEVMMEGIIKPDLILYLRADNQVGVSERPDFGNERYETFDFQTKVTETFDKIFSAESTENNVKIIKSSKSIDDISNEIWSLITDI